MRTIHSERKSRFLSRRPLYPYLSDFSTASCAERWSLLLVRKKPLARASVFLRLLRRLEPRFTLGTFLSLDSYFLNQRIRHVRRTVHWNGSKQAGTRLQQMI